jgi:hypothetical protein
VPGRLLLAAAAAALLAPAAASAASAADGVAPYRATASWVDIYDHRLFARPEAVVHAMAQRGVRTLYLETGNHRQRRAIPYAGATARFIEAAHDEGMWVVAWYLPGYDDLMRDLRRSLAAIAFTTPAGESFDGFALDIEATEVRSVARRSAAAVTLARRLREAVPEPYALGAIVPDSDAVYWRPFPYRALRPYVDAWLPMAYFTFRTRGERRVRAITRRNVEVVRAASGDPGALVHVIGGLAGRASGPEVRGFVNGALDAHADGGSLYSYAGMRGPFWAQLARLSEPLPSLDLSLPSA